MTERFAQAIEQLGSESLEVRLGGIYSLERTAQEERNYHWPIMEVLTSYVRRHAAWEPGTESDENPPASPKPDIQAILDVIGRRSEHHRTDETVESGTIDLRATDLRGASLRGAHLERASLWAVHLERADLGGAYLGGADLGGANLREARNLTQAQLDEANGAETTRLPPSLKPPGHWAVKSDEQAEED
jgi:hypothetical protein